MKVLVAIPYFAPAYAFGGSVTVAQTTVEGLLAAGHEVTVATTDVFDERRRMTDGDPVLPDGVRAVRFPNVSHRAAAGANVYLPRGLRRWLAAHVREFDVVLLQDVYSAVSVMTARACARAGVPYVLQAHGTVSPAPERGRSIAKQGFLALWGRRTLADATAMFCITAHERDEHLAVGADPSKIIMMPLPLKLPRLGDVSPAPMPTVAFLGRLHPIKRIDLLIEAVAHVRRSLPDARLEIAGPENRHAAQLRDHARRLGIADAVRFHGYLGGDDKARLLASAHVSALLSDGEGLPVSALEAMACGTPVVLSEGCHFPEADGRAGIVVRSNAEAAAAAITRLLTDADERRRLEAGARDLANAFRHDVVLPRMVSVLEAVAGAGRSLTGARS